MEKESGPRLVLSDLLDLQRFSYGVEAGTPVSSHIVSKNYVIVLTDDGRVLLYPNNHFNSEKDTINLKLGISKPPVTVSVPEPAEEDEVEEPPHFSSVGFHESFSILALGTSSGDVVLFEVNGKEVTQVKYIKEFSPGAILKIHPYRSDICAFVIVDSEGTVYNSELQKVLGVRTLSKTRMVSNDIYFSRYGDLFLTGVFLSKGFVVLHDANRVYMYHRPTGALCDVSGLPEDDIRFIRVLGGTTLVVGYDRDLCVIPIPDCESLQEESIQFEGEPYRLSEVAEGGKSLYVLDKGTKGDPNSKTGIYVFTGRVVHQILFGEDMKIEKDIAYRLPTGSFVGSANYAGMVKTRKISEKFLLVSSIEKPNIRIYRLRTPFERMNRQFNAGYEKEIIENFLAEYESAEDKNSQSSKSARSFVLLYTQKYYERTKDIEYYWDIVFVRLRYYSLAFKHWASHVPFFLEKVSEYVLSPPEGSDVHVHVPIGLFGEVIKKHRDTLTTATIDDTHFEFDTVKKIYYVHSLYYPLFQSYMRRGKNIEIPTGLVVRHKPELVVDIFPSIITYMDLNREQALSCVGVILGSDEAIKHLPSIEGFFTKHLTQIYEAAFSSGADSLARYIHYRLRHFYHSNLDFLRSYCNHMTMGLLLVVNEPGSFSYHQNLDESLFFGVIFPKLFTQPRLLPEDDLIKLFLTSPLLEKFLGMNHDRIEKICLGLGLMRMLEEIYLAEGNYHSLLRYYTKIRYEGTLSKLKALAESRPNDKASIQAAISSNIVDLIDMGSLELVEFLSENFPEFLDELVSEKIEELPKVSQYHLLQSFFNLLQKVPSPLHPPASVVPHLKELYILRLCEFNGPEVLRYLKRFDTSYKIDVVLEAAIEHQVIDAQLYLYERSGNLKKSWEILGILISRSIDNFFSIKEEYELPEPFQILPESTPDADLKTLEDTVISPKPEYSKFYSVLKSRVQFALDFNRKYVEEDFWRSLLDMFYVVPKDSVMVRVKPLTLFLLLRYIIWRVIPDVNYYDVLGYILNDLEEYNFNRMNVIVSQILENIRNEKILLQSANVLKINDSFEIMTQLLDMQTFRIKTISSNCSFCGNRLNEKHKDGSASETVLFYCGHSYHQQCVDSGVCMLCTGGSSSEPHMAHRESSASAKAGRRAGRRANRSYEIRRSRREISKIVKVREDFMDTLDDMNNGDVTFGSELEEKYSKIDLREIPKRSVNISGATENMYVVEI